MSANLTTRDATVLNDAELDLVTGGTSTATLNNPLLAAAENLTLIQPIHLNPLPPLHVAVPHF